MTNLLKNVLALCLCAALFSFVACSSGTTEGQDASTEVVDKTGPEYTSAYVCPMHCKGSGSDQAGKCPVCKMDYVANENAKAHDHSGHDHSHDGHDHSGHDHEH